MAAHPDGAWPWPSHISPTHPYPAAVPGPIARRPHVSRTRSDRDDLDLNRRRGRRRHNDGLRGRGGRLWRRGLRRHRGRSLSLPIGGRRRRGGGRAGSGWRLGGSRLGLVGHRRRVRLLHHVGRLSVVHGHIGHRARFGAAGGDEGGNTSERETRGACVGFHKFKMFHIQWVGRMRGPPGSVKTHTNVRAFCNRLGGSAVLRRSLRNGLNGASASSFCSSSCSKALQKPRTTTRTRTITRLAPVGSGLLRRRGGADEAGEVGLLLLKVGQVEVHHVAGGVGIEGDVLQPGRGPPGDG